MAKEKKAKKSADEGYVKYTRESLPRLRQKYQDEVVKKLTDEFGYKNVMEVPRLVKVTINMGLGRAVATPKIMESADAPKGLAVGAVSRIRSFGYLCGKTGCRAPVMVEAGRDVPAAI